MSEKIPVTKAGLEELKKELDHFIRVERPNVIEQLREARAQGDLSENADYDAARDRQAYVESKIRELEKTLDNVELIEDNNGGYQTVRLGATVTILDVDFDEEETFTIVGSVEADPDNGKLSNVSPLAQAMLDKKVGDVVTVTQVEKPYDVKILNIK
ncbi:MAG: transcription elongation factor GreA [Erysipelothrix sp.]|nr:transcription elongation factor GreA [Erysipelothrix sp.]